MFRPPEFARELTSKPLLVFGGCCGALRRLGDFFQQNTLALGALAGPALLEQPLWHLRPRGGKILSQPDKLMSSAIR